MGMLEYYDMLKDRETCPTCRRKMELVKTPTSLWNDLSGKEDDIFHCENCGRDFPRMTQGRGLAISVKLISKFLPHIPK